MTSLIAIILQTALLNVAMRPFQEMQTPSMKMFEFLIKIIPLLTSSIWMDFNLRYEKNPVQYKKNTKIEMVYCMIQVVVFLLGYYSKIYWLGTLLLITVVSIYIFWINPKYMNRRMTK